MPHQHLRRTPETARARVSALVSQTRDEDPRKGETQAANRSSSWNSYPTFPTLKNPCLRLTLDPKMYTSMLFVAK